MESLGNGGIPGTVRLSYIVRNNSIRNVVDRNYSIKMF